MPETPTVRPGQIWADNDWRSEGRTLRVERIDGDRVLCRILTNSDDQQWRLDNSAWRAQDRRGKTVSIALGRMRPTSTGYRLVQEAQSDA